MLLKFSTKDSCLSMSSGETGTEVAEGVGAGFGAEVAVSVGRGAGAGVPPGVGEGMIATAVEPGSGFRCDHRSRGKGRHWSSRNVGRVISCVPGSCSCVALYWPLLWFGAWLRAACCSYSQYQQGVEDAVHWIFLRG